MEYVRSLKEKYGHSGYVNAAGDLIPCENECCQLCCPHDDIDDLICLSCKKEFLPCDLYDEDSGRDR